MKEAKQPKDLSVFITDKGISNENFRESKVIDDTPVSSPGSSSEGSDEEYEAVLTVPYYKLFRFADSWDIFLIIIGTLCGIIHGAGLPGLFIIFGQLTTLFTDYGKYQQCQLSYNICRAMNVTILTQEDWNAEVQPTIDSFEARTIEFCLYFVYIACGVFILATLQTACWTLQAVRQTHRIRSAYFYAIMRQDIGFHDVTSAGDINARLASDIDKVKDGMANKVSTTIQYVSMAIAGVVVGLVYSWKVGLVTLSISPLLAISTILMLKVSSIYTAKELNAYAKSGSVAEEAISAVRTVVAFGCQRKEIERYEKDLNGVKKVGVKKGFAVGFSIGFLYLSVFGMYGLAFWYGSTLVIAEEITVGSLTTSFFGILIAAFSFGTAGSYTSAFSDAKAAGGKIFQILDRSPSIDIFSDEGDDPNFENGEILFNDVNFYYPSRTEVQVLKNVSLTIEHGKTTALVGQSGCGKSTIIQLIRRFYDVTEGSITVGGKDVKTLNVKKHRELIGVVSQEPVLFATTIAENIRWGREGVTDDEIQQAAKQANAYDFIMRLPDKFETLVGEGGGQMSGGQKQRIAIARAIVRNPKILLLDEATSALDTESESIVQEALDKAASGRTTVVIAHRLSTIRNSDKIIAFHDGAVMEEGTHQELLQKKNGVYANLVNMNSGRDENKDEVISSQNKEKSIPDVEMLATNQQPRGRIVSSTSHKSSFKNHDLNRNVKNKKYQDDKDDDVEVYPEIGFKKILAMNKPEWMYMAVGCVFATMAGSIDPINGVIFAEILNIFILNDPVEQNRLASLYGLLFLALGAVGFIAYIFESTLFAKSGVELTVRLRKKAFASILRQDISYFDDHHNSTGALCTRLSSDASKVQGCTGARLGLALKNFASLGVALGISFAFGWQLTLLTIAFIPFLAFGGFLEFNLMTGQEQVEKEANEEAGQVAGEAIKNIRTVASMTKEKKMHELYVSKLEQPYKKTKKRALIIGLGYGYSQCVIYFAYAAVFRLGIYLVISNLMTFDNVFKVLTAVIFGAMAVGQNSSLAPDYAEAKISANRMFALFEKVPEIDATSDAGLSPAHCKGEVSLNSVSFTYPTRPDVPVLRGCTVSVKSGETLALVGQSGCGKSTSVQLIERFYDPLDGEVTLDGVDIRKLNVSWLRHQMGLVSQEPVLFNQSIMENIRYGNCKKEASLEEVEAAARNANIDNFIKSLPDGYKTSAGAKGSQLSGGQKQRVAIARALLRNPKILLLDEATSALDAESEKIVQEALDSAREGRTCIIIAHRLSTVRNADQIAVIDNGVVAEAGTHDQLIALKGAYYSLVKAQLTNNDRSFTSDLE